MLQHQATGPSGAGRSASPKAHCSARPASTAPQSLSIDGPAALQSGAPNEPKPAPVRCVQTGGPSGPITQGKFDGHGMYLPCGIWAWVIDGRYVPGRLIDPHPETLRQKSATAGVDVMARRINVQIAGQDPSRNDWLTR